MNAASAMTTATSQGLRSPAAERSGVQPPLAAASAPAISVHLHLRDDGKARAERAVALHSVEYDLDRYSLHDLHIVTGRVFRREQREGLPGPALNGIYMPFDVRIRARIDVNRCVLAGTDV